MPHLSLEELTDFARGIAPSGMAMRVREHLSAGCEDCARVATMLQRVAEAAAQEARYEPDPGSVRIAKAHFAILGPRASKLRELLPLVFDSLAAPAPAGIRAALITSRQLLYRKDNRAIDIRLEHAPEHHDGILVGQVLDSGHAGRNVGSILVEMLSGGKVVASTATTTFGEFQFLYPPDQEIELCFGISSQQVFWIKVPPLATLPESGVVIQD
jgi:hypothetical protein